MSEELGEKKEQVKQKKADIKEALMNLLNSSTSGGNQYVTFAIGQEEYGIEIKQVQEITAYRTLTSLPNTPHYVKGILNLRGNVIPIMDPRIKFGMPEVEYNKSSVIIIFKTHEKTIGMIVDKISDVLTIEQAAIQETPEMAMNIDTQFLNGVGKVGEKFIIILDIDKIFKHDA
ncbi:MAG TPA: chemotaxis protein CheW [Bacteriovoracaceae bacterium]|nr:chemotaxis protein CheW [Bacteriovoracaceae bacterium]